MKNIKKALGAAALSALLIGSSPVIAQSSAPENTANTRMDDRDRDDKGKWGLAGLLGLLGLIGLKGKDRDYRNHNVSTNPSNR